MYLLDTNVLSEIRRGSSPAVDWMAPIPADFLFVSVITLGEIARGASQILGRDPRAAQVFERWLQTIRARFADGILAVTDEVGIAWGRLEAQRPRGADGLIAATALVHDLTLVTRNVRDFQDLPIRLVDPWRAA